MSKTPMENTIHRTAAFAVLMMGTSALVAPAALAQDATDSTTEEGRTLDVVTVTTTRREENILDVPYNISAVSGEDIEGAITLDSAELLRSIPGVSLIDQGPRNGAQFNSIRIRGLNVDSSALGDFAVPSVATVATYVNETPVFANLALIDLERVEVLRGPQATLYGSGALGGTVKYLVRAPQMGETEGRIGATASQVDGSDSLGYAYSGVLNVPVGEKLALRFNALVQDYPGITDYNNIYVLDQNGVPTQPLGLFARGPTGAEFRSVEDADTFESTYFRASAKFEPTANSDFTFNYFFQDDEVGGRRQPSAGTDGFGEEFDEFENGAVILEPSEREFNLASLEANIDLGFATLTSATSYYENEGSSESDNTGFYANNFPQFYYYYSRPLYTAERTFGDESFIQEVRLVSPGGDTFDYVAGIYYQDQTRTATQVSDLVGFEAYADALFPPFDFVSTDNVFTYERTEEYEEIAVFGELTWNVTDDLSFTGGLRWFDATSDVSTFVRTGAYDSIAGEVTTPFESSEDDVLFKLNAAYEFGDDDLLFATISEGYRRGGNNGVPTIGRFANDPAWQIFDSDTVTNYEVGIKGTFNEQRYDVSAFYIDWQNPQFNTSAPIGAFFAVVNGEEAASQGLEVQLSGPLGDKFAYALGYAYVDSELTAPLLEPPTLGSPDPVLVAEDGTILPGVPEHALNLALDYITPISSNVDFIGRVDGFYQSETENVLDPDVLADESFDGFAIWDLTATLQWERWNASLFVKNVFNEDGTTGAFTSNEFGPNVAADFAGSNSRTFIALPRTIGVSANFNF
ncbi:MAG: TonB-dependent receptor [Pseudomonadota bacterium]